MQCPYCGKEMEKGMIISSEPINFMKEVRFINRPKKRKGEFNLATPHLGGRSHVDVCLCRECRKIVIEY